VNPLHELIRRLPAGVEFLIVISWAFGLSIFQSIISMGTNGQVSAPNSGAMVFDNPALLNIVISELLRAAFLIWFLYVRGWTLEKVGLAVSWRGTGMGWLLLLGTYVLPMAAQALASLALPSEMQAAAARYPTADPHLSMQLVFVASTANGIFEELFVAGYIITVMREARGVWVAINVSTVVRLLYHLYQGPLAVLTIVPMGILYGYFYARTRQLWPLIFAHVLVDIIGLSELGRMIERL
jgi:uncharacterized protein